MVFRAQRPDLDQKRSGLLKLQGEFQLRLRRLEKNLLSCLNKAKGRALNNDIRWLKTKNKKALLERMRLENRTTSNLIKRKYKLVQAL